MDGPMIDGSMIRAVIFDLDGTLADTVPVCFAAFRITLKEYMGRDYSDSEIEAMFGPDEAGVFQRLLTDHWRTALHRYLDEYEIAHELCCAPFDGVLELLDWLRLEGMKVAIVTGKGKQSAAISLRRVGLTSHFDMVEAGSHTGPVKPAAIKHILERWGLSPAQAVYVGDAPYDVRAAREAGVIPLSAVWAPRVHRELLDAEKPAAMLETVDDLKGWLAVRAETVPTGLLQRVDPPTLKSASGCPGAAGIEPEQSSLLLTPI